MKWKEFYRRNLPHWQPPLCTFFVTYRLAGSLPVSKINELKEQQKLLSNEVASQKLSHQQKNILHERLFRNFDNCLDENPNGPYWLSNERIAKLVMDSLIFNDKKIYSLWGATIMPNHVHTLLSTLQSSPPLNVILQNHKKFTAKYANKILGREGQFWQRESFDKIVWNEEQFDNTIRYIINNPVKAGLIDNWRGWPWTYVHPLIARQLMLVDSY